MSLVAVKMKLIYDDDGGIVVVMNI